MIELRHLRYFIAVAEELHFGRAAERLHIAQPGLSQQIQALERGLGVRLLERTRRRVQLTFAGQTLLKEGRRALAQLEEAEALARRAGQGEIGLLTIAATESATYFVLPDVLREYRRRFPNVELVVREMTTPLQMTSLRRGEIDVGFVRTPVDMEGMAALTIRQDQLGVLLPEGHALASRRRIPLQALAQERMIIYPAAPRPSWADFVIAACRSAGFEPQVVQQASESPTAAIFVAAGLGVTLVPESLAGLARPGVVFRRISGQAHATEIVLVHRRENVPETVNGLCAVVNELWPHRVIGGRR